MHFYAAGPVVAVIFRTYNVFYKWRGAWKKFTGEFCELLPLWLSVQIALYLYLYVKQKIIWSHINNHLGP